MEDNAIKRERSRPRRGERPTRFSGGEPSAGGGERDRSAIRISKRIYVSNIPYEFRWQDLKDLFRKMVGTVEFVELFKNKSDKPRGCGIVEFKELDSVQIALDKMNRYELNGREIVVKEDHGEERDAYGRIALSVNADEEDSQNGRAGGGGNSLRGGGGGGKARGGQGGRDRDDGRNYA